jgi:hypothetical protein
MRSFYEWLEGVETMTSGAREIILNFLRDELNIKDDEAILNMRTTDIDGSVISKLIRELSQPLILALQTPLKTASLLRIDRYFSW